MSRENTAHFSDPGGAMHSPQTYFMVGLRLDHDQVELARMRARALRAEAFRTFFIDPAVRAVTRAYTAFATRMAERRTVTALEELSDEILKDIGVARDQIPMVAYQVARERKAAQLPEARVSHLEASLSEANDEVTVTRAAS